MSTPAQRQAESERATIAWGGARSPVAGIAEGIRSAKKPKPARSLDDLRADQLLHRLAQRSDRRDIPITRGTVEDRSQYMPHQGARECALRRRQLGPDPIAASGGTT